jgi:predicted permease
MSSFDMQSSGVAADWMIFVAILVAVGIAIACFIIWLFMFRKTKKRRKRREGRHHRKLNPTLAETGGLPPPRAPNQPPRGA